MRHFYDFFKRKNFLPFLSICSFLLIGINEISAQCSDPSPESVCTPPSSWDSDVVATGTVTWSSLSLGSADNVTSKIRISGTGTVRITSGDLLLKSSNAVVFIDGPTLVLENGNIQLDNSGSTYLQHGGALQTYGNFQQTTDSYICIIGTQIEIGEEAAGTNFTTESYTSANWQNDGGYRYLKNDCINVTQDFQLQSTGSGTGTSGVDVILDCCIEIGDAGANHATGTAFGTSDGDDSGNWQNSNRQYIARTDIIVANGNYQTSDGTMTLCTVDIKVNKSGSFQVNSGTVNGEGVCVAVEDIFENSGTWSATNITWHSNKNGSTNVPNAGSETAESTILAQCFGTCSCEGTTEAIDLELVKSVNNTTPNVGGTVTFTIQVDNKGTGDATGVEVKDIVPGGYSNITNISNSGSESSGTITWSGLSITANNNVSLTFDATVDASGDYKNTAQITAVTESTDPDSSPNNDAGNQSEDDESSATVIPTPVIDVELTNTVNNTTPDIGGTVTFTVKVANRGPSNATNVDIKDVVPNGYTNISNISNSGTASGNTITWTGFDINVNDSISLTFDTEVLSTGDYKNIAEVTAHTETDIDSQPNNDDGDQSQDDEDNATVTVPSVGVAKIGIAKMLKSLSANGDGSFNATWVLFVENIGTAPIYDLLITDDLSTEFGTNQTSAANVDAAGEYAILTTPSVTNTGGSAIITNILNTYNGGTNANLVQPTSGDNLPVGANATIEFAIKFYPTANKTTFSNQAEAYGDGTENGTADREGTDLSDASGSPCGIGGSGLTAGGNDRIILPTGTGGKDFGMVTDPNCDGDAGGTEENDPNTFSIQTVTGCTLNPGVLGY